MQIHSFYNLSNYYQLKEHMMLSKETESCTWLMFWVVVKALLGGCEYVLVGFTIIA